MSWEMEKKRREGLDWKGFISHITNNEIVLCGFEAGCGQWDVVFVHC
jgi:hypothetical protein